MSVEEKRSLSFAADILLAQIEALSNEELKGEELEEEIKKTQAIQRAADSVNRIGVTMNKTLALSGDLPANKKIPRLLDV